MDMWTFNTFTGTRLSLAPLALLCMAHLVFQLRDNCQKCNGFWNWFASVWRVAEHASRIIELRLTWWTYTDQIWWKNPTKIHSPFKSGWTTFTELIIFFTNNNDCRGRDCKDCQNILALVLFLPELRGTRPYTFHHDETLLLIVLLNTKRPKP